MRLASSKLPAQKAKTPEKMLAKGDYPFLLGQFGPIFGRGFYSLLVFCLKGILLPDLKSISSVVVSNMFCFTPNVWGFMIQNIADGNACFSDGFPTCFQPEARTSVVDQISLDYGKMSLSHYDIITCDVGYL